MLESISGTYAFGTGNRHQPFFGCCPRGVRNWKQACPIFSELPAWSSELETGMSHFFGVARVEFRVEFPGSASTCPGQVRRNFRQWSTGQLEKIVAEVVGLDDNLDIFLLGRIHLGAWQAAGSDAGQARPGGYARQECGALGVGRTRIGRAIKQGWGEPSNGIGRTTQPLSQWPTPARAWRCACSALCLLGTSS